MASLFTIIILAVQNLGLVPLLTIINGRYSIWNNSTFNLKFQNYDFVTKMFEQLKFSSKICLCWIPGIFRSSEFSPTLPVFRWNWWIFSNPSNRPILTKMTMSNQPIYGVNRHFNVVVNKNLSIVELFKKLNKRFSSELLYWLYLHSRINIWEYLWIIKRPDKSTSPPTQPFSNLTTFDQGSTDRQHSTNIYGFEPIST